MQLNSSQAWYAVHVKSQAEKRVSFLLGQKGYETFLPLRRAPRDWKTERKSAESPLFPGYLFCQMDARLRLPVLTTPGVFGVVGHGRTPLPVQQSEIDRIQRIIESEVAVQPWPYLQAGQSVVIRCGPLRGLEGIVVALKKQFRLIVSVSLLQRAVAVEVDVDWLEKSPYSNPVRMSA